MSPAPGVQVTTAVAKRKTRPGPATVFMPVVSLRGRSDVATLLGSMPEFEPAFGARDSGSLAYDSLDTAFGEGAPRAYAVRIVGPAAVKASKALVNATATTALTVTAREFGAYWNATTVAVAVAGTDFTLTIVAPDGTTHVSPTLADLAAAVAWSLTLTHFTITSTGTTDPVAAAAAALTGGNDDRAGITETQRAAARAILEKRLGPGTHLEPGVYAEASIKAIAAYCNTTNRLAQLALPTTLDVAAAVAAEAAVANTPGGWRVKLHRSWATIPGVAPGVPRTVDWASIEAGMLGRNDAQGVAAGQPAAGSFGVSKLALSLVDEFTDAQRATLNDAHVNVAIVENDEIKGYSNRSLSTTPGQVQFSMARTRMIIQAAAEAAGAIYVLRLMGGDLHELAAYHGQLIGICQRHRVEGSLFGSTDDDAFRIQVAEVNSDANLLAGILNATIDILPAGASEFVRINITSHAEAIGA